VFSSSRWFDDEGFAHGGLKESVEVRLVASEESTSEGVEHHGCAESLCVPSVPICPLASNSENISRSALRHRRIICQSRSASNC